MFGLIPRRREKGLLPYEPPMELLRREFAPLFERMFGRWPAFAETEGVPPYGPEMEETAEALIVREAVPGFEAKEIEVKISGNLLTVHALRKDEGGRDGEGVERMEAHRPAAGRRGQGACGGRLSERRPGGAAAEAPGGERTAYRSEDLMLVGGERLVWAC